MIEPSVGYYAESYELANALKIFLASCLKDNSFGPALDKVIAGVKMEKNTLLPLFLLDCYKCYINIGITVDFNELPCLALLLATALLTTNNDISRESLTYRYSVINSIQDFIDTHIATAYDKLIKFEQIKNTDFIIANAFSEYSPELAKQYYRIMYRLSLLAVQCQEKITSDQSRWMAEIFKLSL